MGGLSIWHVLILAIVVLLIMGRGKISELMGDVARGIKSFRKGLSEDEHKPLDPNQKDAEPKDRVKN